MRITLSAIFLLFFSIANAQESNEKEAALKKASIQLAIDYIVNSSDSETGLWINPHIYKQVKWEKTGKQIETEEPIREIVGYEDAWAWVNRPTPSDPYNKVYEKYKRPIYKITGTRKIMVDEVKPTKEQSSISYCQRRYIELMNALGAYTVLEMKSENSINDKMNKYYEWQNNLSAYGLSDNTVELSLQILMMIKGQGASNEKLIYDGLNKLLEGQINNGSGKGLWGYYSVTWEHDAMLDKQIAGLEAKITALKIPTIKDGEKVPPEVEKLRLIKVEIEQGINDLKLRKALQTREFFEGRKWYENRKIEVLNQAMPTYYFWPMTEFDARERGLGCLLSTQVALYALNEANKAGYFSEENLKKIRPRYNIQLPKSRAFVQLPALPSLKTVVADTLSYFLRTQDKNGVWVKNEEEAKVVHPYPEMLKIKNTFLEHSGKKEIKKHEIKRPPVEDSATVSAMHSLSIIAQILGKAEAKAKINEKIVSAGLNNYNKIIEKIFTDEKLKDWDAITIYPYEFLITLPDIEEAFGGTMLSKPEGKKNLYSFLIKIQNETGNFSKEINPKYNSPFQPHPFFPIIIQNMWEEKDYYNGYWEHGQINIPLMATSLSLLTLKKIEPDSIKYDAKWLNAIEDFTKLRFDLFGIKSDILNKPATEEKPNEVKPADEKPTEIKPEDKKN